MQAFASLIRIARGFAAAGALLVAGHSNAAGLLTPADASFPPLEIREHHVSVVIEDGYAVTTVDQIFHNPHQKDLEAVYSFPVPERGAVAEFSMWIDGKPVVGEVIERQRARELYKQEKRAGREAGVTERDAYKTFDMRVAPVRAGQDQRVRLVYLQPAQVDTGIGRYVYALEEGRVDEQKLAFWTANEKVSHRFSFDLRLKSAYPVDGMRAASHSQALIKQSAPGDWSVKIDGAAVGQAAGADNEEAAAPANVGPPTAAAFSLDKDLVVYWRHAAGLPGSVDLIAHKTDAGGRGTFMLVVTPGDDLKPISEGRDWVFVLDMSGSMQGKYATLADGVRKALGKMRPEDRFRLVLFNDSARELTPGFVNATPDAVRQWSDQVAAIQPGGGTNLYAGVEKGLGALEADRSSGVVLVTDGVANVGETAHRKFLELVRRRDVRLFTFVMGNSANRPLLDSMTRASGGFAISVSSSDDVVGQLLTATSKLTHEAFHGAKLEINGVKTADLTPADLGSVYRGQQMVVFGHYWGSGPADVRLRGKMSGRAIEYRTRFDFPAGAKANPEIERLWAYARIDDMLEEIRDFGEQADVKQAVTDLGVEYGLVTDYTSMVVLREEMFEKHGIKRQNRDRRADETAAQAQRARAAAPSRRVDTQQPMYDSNRAVHSSGRGSGGGAMGPWGVALLLPLVFLVLRGRALHQTAGLRGPACG
jgi:Ca-activated chloride channel homolog